MVLCLLYRVFSELKYLENNVDYIEERGKLEFLPVDFDFWLVDLAHLLAILAS